MAPSPEEAAPLPAELEDVAAQLALRRVSEGEAQALLATIAEDHPEFGLEDYGRIFRRTFERIAGHPQVVSMALRFAMKMSSIMKGPLHQKA